MTSLGPPDPISNSRASDPLPLLDDPDEISKLAGPKIKEANASNSFLSLIGRNISWAGHKIDGFFGGFFGRCYSLLFKSKIVQEVELEEVAKNDGLDEMPIDECFSSEEIDKIATKDATPFEGEKVLIKGIYGYRLVEIESIEDDDINLKNSFFEIKIHVKRNDIWHFKPIQEIDDRALKAQVINLTQPAKKEEI